MCFDISTSSHEGHPSGLTFFTLTRFRLELMLDDRTLRRDFLEGSETSNEPAQDIYFDYFSSAKLFEGGCQCNNQAGDLVEE